MLTIEPLPALRMAGRANLAVSQTGFISIAKKSSHS